MSLVNLTFSGSPVLLLTMSQLQLPSFRLSRKRFSLSRTRSWPLVSPIRSLSIAMLAALT
jgi:hypothetical protein